MVSGEIGTENDNHLKYRFRTDQTILPRLIRDLEVLLAIPVTSD